MIIRKDVDYLIQNNAMRMLPIHNCTSSLLKDSWILLELSLLCLLSQAQFRHRKFFFNLLWNMLWVGHSEKRRKPSKRKKKFWEKEILLTKLSLLWITVAAVINLQPLPDTLGTSFTRFQHHWLMKEVSHSTSFRWRSTYQWNSPW